ncbi:MAG: 50S ribosomal protein L3 [Nitrospinae bacterium RIFCSPLOWO2_12_FULL_47_7]|nr:MAG: 50S ribosomal protein L3 [Nitrospinae bacterium RIFCSPLOWO2_12_FULL_47_7]
MNSIMGKKVGMTQVFAENGDCVPVTVIAVGRCIPVLNRTKEKNGYEAVLVAYGDKKQKHTNKPMKGFFGKLKVDPARVLVEFRGEQVNEDEFSKQLSVSMFKPGDRVEVVGVSKGKGFAGVMKRFGFAGAPASRGAHEAFRGGGSIGMHTYPGKVFKGKKMPGRMGGDTIHNKRQRVFQVNVEQNVLLLKGAVPGANGGLVRITKSGSAKA